MILSLLLLAGWMWDRVSLDCQGGHEVMGFYYFQATTRQLTDTVCFDDQGQPYPCLAMLPGTPVRFGPEIPDPGIGASISTMADPVENPDMLPTPAVGGLAAWPWFSLEAQPICAVDAAGNDSCGGCP